MSNQIMNEVLGNYYIGLSIPSLIQGGNDKIR